jgi:hypothetical protein
MLFFDRICNFTTSIFCALRVVTFQPTLKLEDHRITAVCNYILNVITATFHA